MYPLSVEQTFGHLIWDCDNWCELPEDIYEKGELNIFVIYP